MNQAEEKKFLKTTTKTRKENRKQEKCKKKK